MGRSMQAGVRLALAGVVAGTASLVLTEPASAHGRCRAPASVERVSQLWAGARTSCPKARRLATAYDERVMAGGSFPDRQPLRVNGFTCTTAAAGPSEEETFRVRCGSGHLLVRFSWGV